MITAMIDGHQWHWKRARLSDVLEVPGRVEVWHLWDSWHEYVGNFATKAKMLAWINDQQKTGGRNGKG